MKKILNIISVPAIICAGKLACFIFDALLGAYYGAGITSDAFIMAHTLQNILFDGIATAIIVCFIPIYQEIMHFKTEKLSYFCSNIINLSAILGIIIVIFFIVLKIPILKIYSGGVNDETFNKLNFYISIMIWAIPFTAAYSIFRAYLQVNNGKSVSNIFQIIIYLTLIISLIAFFPNDSLLAWAAVVGNIISFLVLLFLSYKQGFRYLFVISLKDKYLKSTLFAMIPILAGSLIIEFNAIMDKYFSSFFAAGIVTSMSYGYKLSFSIQGIVASSAMIIIYPVLAELAVQKKFEDLKLKIEESAEIIALLIWPLVTGGFVLAYPIIKVVFGHGNFSDESVGITSQIFAVYLLGVVPMSIKHIGDKVCYSLKMTRFTLYSSVLSVVLNLILNIFFKEIWGYIGLALATDLSILIGCIFIYIFIYKYNRKLIKITLVKKIIKPVIPSVIMGITVFLFSLIIKQEQFSSDAKSLLGLILSVFIGIIVYFISICFFYKEKVNKIYNEFLNKG